MSNWQNWYKTFLETKRDNELKAFAAGLNGETYEVPIIKPRFDSTSSWSELISIVKSNEADYGSIDFILKEGSIRSENPIILVCVNKALKINGNYGIDRVLNYLIFNFLKSSKVTSMIDFIKLIREIPEELFLNCNSCGENNQPGWTTCSNCQIEIENSYDEDLIPK
jgi:hypothetical protein